MLLRERLTNIGVPGIAHDVEAPTLQVSTKEEPEVGNVVDHQHPGGLLRGLRHGFHSTRCHGIGVPGGHGYRLSRRASCLNTGVKVTLPPCPADEILDA